MSPAVNDLTGRRLQALLSHDQTAGRLPSLVGGVVRDGELVWSGRHGLHTGGEAPCADLQYRIGSITKTMTAVLIMQLRDEGLVDLNDRLDQHLSEVGYGDRTIRALLSHSSGMQSEPAGSWWERSPGGSFADLAAAIDDSAAVFAPGHSFHYTNLAYALLGEVVSRHRDSTWWEQVRQRILLPLGMTRTSYLAQSPAAVGYSVHHFAGTLNEEPAQDSGAMAPAGQVWSTVTDLATYARFLINGDDAVLSQRTVDEMTTPQTGSFAGGASAGHGLGFQLLAGGSGKLVGHTGSMPGFVAGFFTDRARRTAAIALANGTSGLRAGGLSADLLATLEDLEPTVLDAWEPTGNVADAVAEILGLWHWGNTAYAFAWSKDQVVVSQLSSGLESYRFRPGQDGTFLGTSGYHHGERLEVVRNPDGSVNHLACATFIYTRQPYDPSAPIPGNGG